MNEKMGTERKENVELLKSNEKPLVLESSAESMVSRSKVAQPPDGGAKAYTVVMASFITNGLVFGIINSYSVVYTVLLSRLKEHNVSNPDIKASLAGSLTIGCTFAMSPISGILTGFLGLRGTTVLGGTIAAIGLFLSSFVVDHIEVLCFTYGILYGLGASLAYTPSLAILGVYFKKYLGIVNGIVTIGSSVFTVFMPPLMGWLIAAHGLEWMFRVLSLFAAGIIFCGFMFKPIPVVVIETDSLKPKRTFKSVLKAIGCIEMWKNPRYRLWAICIPVALIGYFVPYVHIQKFIKDNFPSDVNLNLPLQCIAATSALGRFVFGFLSDKKGTINTICLQQISFYTMGTLTIILPFVRNYYIIVAIALGIGFSEGGFIALMGPIAFELVGTQHAAQGIGCILGIAALPLSIGPTIAGALYSTSNSYTLPFVLAGISPLSGATLMFLFRFLKKRSPAPETNTNGHA